MNETGSVLDRIFARKRDEVAAAQGAVPLAELTDRALDVERPRGFELALSTAATPVALIAEVKKASPSKGLIRADFDPVAIAEAYERAGAHAMSVLTDGPGFGGSADDLRRARAATALPVLRKDFVYDEYQVWEARAMGADAILLIAASLSTAQMRDLQGLARSLGMDVLVEVHDEEELARVVPIEASLVGVNNRHLATFATDLGTTQRLFPLLPAGATLVSESALETNADVERVRAAGARAVLIGTTFCAAPNVEAKVREVMSW